MLFLVSTFIRLILMILFRLLNWVCSNWLNWLPSCLYNAISNIFLCTGMFKSVLKVQFLNLVQFFPELLNWTSCLIISAEKLRSCWILLGTIFVRALISYSFFLLLSLILCKKHAMWNIRNTLQILTNIRPHNSMCWLKQTRRPMDVAEKVKTVEIRGKISAPQKLEHIHRDSNSMAVVG